MIVILFLIMKMINQLKIFAFILLLNWMMISSLFPMSKVKVKWSADGPANGLSKTISRSPSLYITQWAKHGVQGVHGIRRVSWLIYVKSVSSRVDVSLCTNAAESVFVYWILLRGPGIGPVRKPYLSYRPARLQRLSESIHRNRFLGSLNVYNYGLRLEKVVCHVVKDSTIG